PENPRAARPTSRASTATPRPPPLPELRGDGFLPRGGGGGVTPAGLSGPADAPPEEGLAKGGVVLSVAGASAPWLLSLVGSTRFPLWRERLRHHGSQYTVIIRSLAGYDISTAQLPGQFGHPHSGYPAAPVALLLPCCSSRTLPMLQRLTAEYHDGPGAL